MQNVVHFDIETIPSQEPWVREYYEEHTMPPKELKKAESIEKWYKEDKAQAVDDSIAKAAFSGASNHICCISWGIDFVGFPDGKIQSAYIGGDVSEEKNILKEFFDSISSNNKFLTFAGHNIIGFDIRVIKQRAMVLGVKIPPCFPIDAKPWSKEVYDTMLKWDSGSFIKMDLIAKAFGIKGKGSVDGSMVYPMWKEGKHEEIALYCEDDVRMGREVYSHMTFRNI